MILNEFTANDRARLVKLTRALSENFDYTLDFDGMTAPRASKLIERAEVAIADSNNINKRIKLGLIAESLDLWMKSNIQTELTDVVAESLDDDAVEGAKVVIAAQELTDKIQGMIEDVAKMQVQDLLPITDAMKVEIGQAEADTFSTTADAALGTLVDALKTAKSGMDEAIASAQGQTPATDMDNFDDDEFGDTDGDLETDMDADLDLDSDDDFDDEFGGDAGNIADDDPTGRELKDE